MSSSDAPNLAPPPPEGIPRATWWWAAAITLVTAVSFAGVWSQPFCGYDEPAFLLRNSMLNRGLTWEGVRWAFTTFYDCNYNPIPWLAAMLDVTLFGMEATRAGPYKMMTVGYHAISAALLLVLLVKATGSVWRSGVVAALFALHPFHVEPVVFVIARKDVLAVMFGFATMLAYLHYARRPGAGRYALVMLLMALALLSKATQVTLPCVLMLMDIWPLRRWTWRGLPGVPAAEITPTIAPACPPRSLRQLILEKVPLLAMSAATGVVAIFARDAIGGVQSLEAIPIATRIANATIAYAQYVGKMFWPVNLCYFYGMHPWTPLEIAGSAVVLLLITLAAIAVFKRAPWVLIGWAFFAGTMLPISGLMQAGAQLIADRYTYFPLTGLFIAIVWSLPDSWLATPARRAAMIASGLAIAAALVGLTVRQVGFWRDDRTVFQHAFDVDPDTNTNLLNLSGQYLADGQPAEARVLTNRLLKLSPNWPPGYAVHGKVLETLGMTVEAESVYRHGIELAPRATKCRLQLADMLITLGRKDEGIAEYETLVRNDPKDLDHQRALADALSKIGRFEQAAGMLRQVLAVDPLDVRSLTNLGVMLDQLNRPNEAIPPLERALALRPSYLEAHENLGAVYARVGRIPEATTQYEWMVKQANQKPEWLATANHRLGLLRSQARRYPEAIACLRKAAELTPNDAQLRNDLGVALAQNREFAAAGMEFEAAVKIDPKHAGALANLARLRAMK